MAVMLTIIKVFIILFLMVGIGNRPILENARREGGGGHIVRLPSRAFSCHRR